MNKTMVARIWYAVIAVSIFIAIPVRTVLSWNEETGDFSEPIARAFNTFCFFTIQTNIIVGVVSLLLVLNMKRDSPRFKVFELAGVVCIIVVSVVYYLLLASDENLKGLAVLTNFVVHTMAPIMFVVGWLVFSHHGKTTWRTVKLALVFPIGWAIFAMVRGAIIGYYPYPFMDVKDLGYATALVNMAFVTAFFIVLFVGAHLLDQKLSPKA